MVRRPYRVACNPWRDDDGEVTLHWYITDPGNGTLPYPSRINSLNWRPDNMNPAPVGEVTFADQVFDGWLRIIPPGPGDHICGTREDFELGGLRHTAQPVLVRDGDGIPTCCRAPIGGMVMGGGGQIQYGGFTAGGGFQPATPLTACGGGVFLNLEQLYFCRSPFLGGSAFSFQAPQTAANTSYRIRMAPGKADRYLAVWNGANCSLQQNFTLFGPASQYDVTFSTQAGSSRLYVAAVDGFFTQSIQPWQLLVELA
jgi:hypothetical protein